MNNKDHLVGQLTSENLTRATDPLSMTALLILLLALIMLIGQEAVIMLIGQEAGHLQSGSGPDRSP